MKTQHLSLIVIGLIFGLLLLRWAVVSGYPVQLTEDKFVCSENVCFYSYQLSNDSDFGRDGEVLIKVYKEGALQTEEVLNTKVEQYQLGAKESKEVSGEIDAPEAPDYLRFIHASK